MYNNNNNNNKNFKEKLSQFLLLSSSTWSSSYCIIPKKNTPKTWSLTPISMQRVMVERKTDLGWCSSSTVLKVHYFGMWALRNFVAFRLVRELHPSWISKEHKSDWVRAWLPLALEHDPRALQLCTNFFLSLSHEPRALQLCTNFFLSLSLSLVLLDLPSKD